MNLLLDTNIVIDYMGGRDPYCEPAERIIAAGFFGNTKLWASTASMKDAYYVLSKYVDQSKLQDSIANLCEVVSLVSLTEDDVLRASRLGWQDFEDCLISMAAEKAKAEYIVTRDSSGFERSSVPVISPSEWIELMLNKHGLDFAIMSGV